MQTQDYVLQKLRTVPSKYPNIHFRRDRTDGVNISNRTRGPTLPSETAHLKYTRYTEPLYQHAAWCAAPLRAVWGKGVPIHITSDNFWSLCSEQSRARNIRRNLNSTGNTGHGTVKCDRTSSTFRTKVLPPSSGSKCTTSNNQSSQSSL